MSTKRRTRRTPVQIFRKLRVADAMLNSGKDRTSVLQTLEVSKLTLDRWCKHYGSLKSKETVRMQKLEEEDGRFKELVAEKGLDIKALKLIPGARLQARLLHLRRYALQR